MHQTTCGVILKTAVENKQKIELLINQALLDYEKYFNDANCLYENNVIINDCALNYLNEYSNNDLKEVIKSIIKNEFDICEKVYPYLGDLFLQYYFKPESISDSFESFRIHKENISEFLETFKNDIVSKIGDWIFKNVSVEYFITIEKTKGNDITIVKDDQISFDLDYDNDFLGGKTKHVMKNYRFLIIDGIIESVSEIHHLLMKASEDKNPYVLFCFGLSEEVKHTIIENNRRGITEIFPVSINLNEDAINILNDIAVIHQSEVISSLKGQTISQAARKELSVGKTITLMRDNLIIEPVCNDRDLKIHRDFLFDRSVKTENEQNRALLVKRIKRMSTKTVKLYIPDRLFLKNDFVRELDYLLRFLKNISKPMIKLSKSNKSFYYFPGFCIELIQRKKESLKTTFDNLEKAILLVGDKNVS